MNIKSRIDKSVVDWLNKYTIAQIVAASMLCALVILAHLSLLFIWLLWGDGIFMTAGSDAVWVWQCIMLWIVNGFVKNEKSRI